MPDYTPKTRSVTIRVDGKDLDTRQREDGAFWIPGSGWHSSDGEKASDTYDPRSFVKRTGQALGHGLSAGWKSISDTAGEIKDDVFTDKRSIADKATGFAVGGLRGLSGISSKLIGTGLLTAGSIGKFFGSEGEGSIGEGLEATGASLFDKGFGGDLSKAADYNEYNTDAAQKEASTGLGAVGNLVGTAGEMALTGGASRLTKAGAAAKGFTGIQSGSKGLSRVLPRAATPGVDRLAGTTAGKFIQKTGDKLVDAANTPGLGGFAARRLVKGPLEGASFAALGGGMQSNVANSMERGDSAGKALGRELILEGGLGSTLFGKKPSLATSGRQIVGNTLKGGTLAGSQMALNEGVREKGFTPEALEVGLEAAPKSVLNMMAFDALHFGFGHNYRKQMAQNREIISGIQNERFIPPEIMRDGSIKPGTGTIQPGMSPAEAIAAHSNNPDIVKLIKNSTKFEKQEDGTMKQVWKPQINGPITAEKIIGQLENNPGFTLPEMLKTHKINDQASLEAVWTGLEEKQAEMEKVYAAHQRNVLAGKAAEAAVANGSVSPDAPGIAARIENGRNSEAAMAQQEQTAAKLQLFQRQLEHAHDGKIPDETLDALGLGFLKPVAKQAREHAERVSEENARKLQMIEEAKAAQKPAEPVTEKAPAQPASSASGAAPKGGGLKNSVREGLAKLGIGQAGKIEAPKTDAEPAKPVETKPAEEASVSESESLWEGTEEASPPSKKELSPADQSKIEATRQRNERKNGKPAATPAKPEPAKPVEAKPTDKAKDEHTDLVTQLNDLLHKKEKAGDITADKRNEQVQRAIEAGPSKNAALKVQIARLKSASATSTSTGKPTPVPATTDGDRAVSKKEIAKTRKDWGLSADELEVGDLIREGTVDKSPGEGYERAGTPKNVGGKRVQLWKKSKKKASDIEVGPVQGDVSEGGNTDSPVVLEDKLGDLFVGENRTAYQPSPQTPKRHSDLPLPAARAWSERFWKRVLTPLIAGPGERDLLSIANKAGIRISEKEMLDLLSDSEINDVNNVSTRSDLSVGKLASRLLNELRSIKKAGSEEGATAAMKMDADAAAEILSSYEHGPENAHYRGVHIDNMDIKARQEHDIEFLRQNEYSMSDDLRSDFAYVMAGKEWKPSGPEGESKLARGNEGNREEQRKASVDAALNLKDMRRRLVHEAAKKRLIAELYSRGLLNEKEWVDESSGEVVPADISSSTGRIEDIIPDHKGDSYVTDFAADHPGLVGPGLVPDLNEVLNGLRSFIKADDTVRNPFVRALSAKMLIHDELGGILQRLNELSDNPSKEVSDLAREAMAHLIDVYAPEGFNRGEELYLKLSEYNPEHTPEITVGTSARAEKRKLYKNEIDALLDQSNPQHDKVYNDILEMTGSKFNFEEDAEGNVQSRNDVAVRDVAFDLADAHDNAIAERELRVKYEKIANEKVDLFREAFKRGTRMYDMDQSTPEYKKLKYNLDRATGILRDMHPAILASLELHDITSMRVAIAGGSKAHAVAMGGMKGFDTFNAVYRSIDSSWANDTLPEKARGLVLFTDKYFGRFKDPGGNHAEGFGSVYHELFHHVINFLPARTKKNLASRYHREFNNKVNTDPVFKDVFVDLVNDAFRSGATREIGVDAVKADALYEKYKGNAKALEVLNKNIKFHEVKEVAEDGTESSRRSATVWPSNREFYMYANPDEFFSELGRQAMLEKMYKGKNLPTGMELLSKRSESGFSPETVQAIKTLSMQQGEFLRAAIQNGKGRRDGLRKQVESSQSFMNWQALEPSTRQMIRDIVDGSVMYNKNMSKYIQLKTIFGERQAVLKTPVSYFDEAPTRITEEFKKMKEKRDQLASGELSLETRLQQLQNDAVVKVDLSRSTIRRIQSERGKRMRLDPFARSAENETFLYNDERLSPVSGARSSRMAPSDSSFERAQRRIERPASTPSLDPMAAFRQEQDGKFFSRRQYLEALAKLPKGEDGVTSLREKSLARSMAMNEQMKTGKLVPIRDAAMLQRAPLTREDARREAIERIKKEREDQLLADIVESDDAEAIRSAIKASDMQINAEPLAVMKTDPLRGASYRMLRDAAAARIPHIVGEGYGVTRFAGKGIQAILAADEITDGTRIAGQIIRKSNEELSSRTAFDSNELQPSHSAIQQEIRDLTAKVKDKHIEASISKADIDAGLDQLAKLPKSARVGMKFERMVDIGNGKQAKMLIRLNNDGKVTGWVPERVLDMYDYLESGGKNNRGIDGSTQEHLDKIIGQMRNTGDEMFKILSNVDGVNHDAIRSLFKENYVMHVYGTRRDGSPIDAPLNIVDPSLASYDSYMNTTALNRLENRKYETYRQAWEKGGFIPMYKNPVETFMAGQSQLSDLITFRRVVGSLIAGGVATYTTPNNLDQNLYSPLSVGQKKQFFITGKDGKRTSISPLELLGFENMGSNTGDLHASPLMWVRNEYMPLLDAAFGEGLGGKFGPVVKAIQVANSILNPLQLFGPFHAVVGATLGQSAGLGAAREHYDYLRASGVSAGEALSRSAMNYIKEGNILAYRSRGNEMKEKMMFNWNKTDEQILADDKMSDKDKMALIMLKRAGASVSSNAIMEHKYWEDVKDHLAAGGYKYLWAGMKGWLAFNTTIAHKGIFNGLIIPMKLGYASRQMEALADLYYGDGKGGLRDGWINEFKTDMTTDWRTVHDRMTNVSDAQLRSQKRELGADFEPLLRQAESKKDKVQFINAANMIWDRADDIFGVVNYRNMFMNPKLKSSLLLLERAFGWHHGNNVLLWKGIHDMAMGAANLNPKTKDIMQKVNYAAGGMGRTNDRLGEGGRAGDFLAGHLAVTGVLGTIISMMVRGLATEEEKKKRAAKVDSMNFAERVRDVAADAWFPVLSNKMFPTGGQMRYSTPGYVAEWQSGLNLFDKKEGVTKLVVGGKSPVFNLTKNILLDKDELNRELGWIPFADRVATLRSLEQLIAKNPEDAQLNPVTGFATSALRRLGRATTEVGRSVLPMGITSSDKEFREGTPWHGALAPTIGFRRTNVFAGEAGWVRDLAEARAAKSPGTPMTVEKFNLQGEIARAKSAYLNKDDMTPLMDMLASGRINHQKYSQILNELNISKDDFRKNYFKSAETEKQFEAYHSASKADKEWMLQMMGTQKKSRIKRSAPERLDTMNRIYELLGI